MRLLFLTQTYPRHPGDTAGPFIRDLARGLARRGDSVTVLIPHAKGVAAAWDDKGVAVRSFRYAPENLERLGYSRSLNADERVRVGAALAAPLYLAGARWAIAREARRGGPYDLLHTHWVVPNGLAALGARLPLAVGLHGSDVFLAERRGLRSVVRRILRRTLVLTGCSPELVERVCALGFERRHAHVIPYGVDTETFRPDRSRRPIWREQLGIPCEAPLVLAVGRLVTKKGFHLLLEGAAELLKRRPTTHLVVAGAGDLEGPLKSAAAEWPGRVHFPGSVERDTLPDLYRAADLFALPAVHDAEGNVDGLPNVVLEAMASGLPVVASRVSGIPLAVVDGETGRLVPEGDVAALVAALDTLLEDPGRAGMLGAAGRRRATGHLTWDAVAERYAAAYEEALTRRS